MEENPFGPLQEYEVAPDDVAERFSVEPAHTGPLFVTVGYPGMGLIVTWTGAETHPRYETV